MEITCTSQQTFGQGYSSHHALIMTMMLRVQDGLCKQQNMQSTYLHTAVILQSNHSQQTLSVRVTD